MMKEANETPTAGRDFKTFLAEHPEIKYSPDRKDAMQVGDYIEMPMEVFKKWVDVSQLGPSAIQVREDIGNALEKKESPEDDSRIVKVRIIEIEEGGEYPRLHMTVEADRVQKRIFSSLFHNLFENHTTDLDIIVSSGNAGFSKSGPTHITPQSDDSVLW